MQTIEMPIEKPAAGGIHSCLLTKEGEVLTFGCGSNGRIGHIESTDHKYLYREGIPRKIESLNEWNIIDLQSSYYHNICVGYKKAK